MLMRVNTDKIIPHFLLLLRHLVGGFFVFSAFNKILFINAFISMLQDYFFTHYLFYFVAYFVIIVEIILAYFLFIHANKALYLFAGAIIFLFLTYHVYILFVLNRSNCGCAFSNEGSSLLPSYFSIIVLILLAVAVFAPPLFKRHSSSHKFVFKKSPFFSLILVSIALLSNVFILAIKFHFLPKYEHINKYSVIHLANPKSTIDSEIDIIINTDKESALYICSYVYYKLSNIYHLNYYMLSYINNDSDLTRFISICKDSCFYVLNDRESIGDYELAIFKKGKLLYYVLDETDVSAYVMYNIMQSIGEDIVDYDDNNCIVAENDRYLTNLLEKHNAKSLIIYNKFCRTCDNKFLNKYDKYMRNTIYNNYKVYIIPENVEGNINISDKKYIVASNNEEYIKNNNYDIYLNKVIITKILNKVYIHIIPIEEKWNHFFDDYIKTVTINNNGNN